MARTTADQYLLYVECLKVTHTGEGLKQIDEIWDQLTSALNSSGLGPVTTKEAWKKVNIFYIIKLIALILNFIFR